MKSSQIYGLIGSILSGIIIILLLMFVFMPFEKQDEEEGIMVSFGDGVEGLGESAAEETTALPTTPPPAPPTKDELMTQDDEDTVALEAQKRKEKEEKKRQELIAEQKPLEELEKQRIEAERIAEQKRIEDEQAEKTAKAGKAGSVFGQSVGVGQSSGTGTSGNPAGKGSSNGNDWNLSGRDLRGGIPKPAYNANEEGKIVVSIRVDENGNVISATTGQGTTITDRTLVEKTLEAAKKVKFSAGKNNVYGTITYKFKLN